MDQCLHHGKINDLKCIIQRSTKPWTTAIPLHLCHPGSMELWHAHLCTGLKPKPIPHHWRECSHIKEACAAPSVGGTIRRIGGAIQGHPGSDIIYFHWPCCRRRANTSSSVGPTVPAEAGGVPLLRQPDMVFELAVWGSSLCWWEGRRNWARGGREGRRNWLGGGTSGRRSGPGVHLGHAELGSATAIQWAEVQDALRLGWHLLQGKALWRLQHSPKLHWIQRQDCQPVLFQGSLGL